MHATLCATRPAFAAAWQRCGRGLRRHGVDLDFIVADERVHRIENAQAAMLSFSVAAAAWLEHLGLRPDVVIGHSAGELAAAHLAGAISLDDALALAVARGRAMAAAPPGGMLAVFASPERAADALGAAAEVEIAAENAPGIIVVAGTSLALEKASQTLAARGIDCRRIDVGCAAHSTAMNAVLGPFGAAIDRVAFQPPATTWISTCTADVMAVAPSTAPAHFLRQLRDPVRFVPAVRRAIELGVDAFVELSPTGGLASCVRQIDDQVLVEHVGCDDRAGLAALARCFEAGLPVSLSGLGTAARATTTQAPLHRFRRRRFELPAPAPAQARTGIDAASVGEHLLLAAQPGIRDHVVAGRSTAPAAFLVDRALSAASKRGGGPRCLRDVVVPAALELTSTMPRTLVIEFGADDVVRVHSSAGGASPVVHLTGRAAPAMGRVFARLDVDAAVARTPRVLNVDALYGRLAESGYAMGPAARGLRAVFVAAAGPISEVRAVLATPDSAPAGLVLDAAVLDGVAHASAAFFADAEADGASVWLGFSIERIEVYRPVHQRCSALLQRRSAVDQKDVLRFDATLVDDDGDVIAEVFDFAARRVGVARAAPENVAVPAASPTSDRARIETVFRQQLGRRLRRRPDAIAAHEPFANLGVDSLMAVETVRALKQELGLSIRPTLLFEARTLAEAVDLLVAINEGRQR